jgi:hypothetical protein
MSRLSATCGRIAGSTAFDVVIFAVIVANAVVLGLETYDELRSDIGGLLNTLNDPGSTARAPRRSSGRRRP